MNHIGEYLEKPRERIQRKALRPLIEKELQQIEAIRKRADKTLQMLNGIIGELNASEIQLQTRLRHLKEFNRK